MSERIIKHDQHFKRRRRRLKSLVVRDPNGSISTFRQFYQSGGRDYEQYRRWLKTLSDQEKLSTSIDNPIKIKTEPNDSETNVTNILPSSQQSSSIEKVVYRHSLFRPIQQISMPGKSQYLLPLSTYSPSQLTTISFESPYHRSYNHSSLPTQPLSHSASSSSLNNWSVTDVAQFIEKQFSDKTLIRKFLHHKIDGRTLPLLTEDHLLKIFKMKLGPALYLLALISNLEN